MISQGQDDTLSKPPLKPQNKCQCHLTQLSKHSVHVPRYDMIEIACWRFDCPMAENHVAQLVADLVKMYALTYINCHDKSLMRDIRSALQNETAPYYIYRIKSNSSALLRSLYAEYYAHVDVSSVYLQCNIYTYTRLVDYGMHINFAFWGPPDVYREYNIHEDAITYPTEFREKIASLVSLEKLIAADTQP